MMRTLISVQVALGCVATTARAQDPPSDRPSALEIRVQLGFLPLYGGDATVGSVSTWMPSAGLGYRLPLAGRRAVIEASFAHVGQNRDPYNRAPSFTFLGVLLRESLRPATGKGVEPFLTVGLGRLQVDAEEIVCQPPTCFSEGGPNFVDGTFMTVVGGAGIIMPFTRWGALRGDLRVFLPRNAGANAGDSDNARLEVGAGLVLRW